ncbi:MAG: LAGLIDADG family homing endonuclease [Nanoarchaeota archaeon]
MRIILKKNYQRKLILLCKEKNNLTWNELANKIKISEGYLRNELLKEKRTIDERIYRKLNRISGKNFDKYISEKIDDNWGRSKGGRTGIKQPQLLVNKTSKELAELIGIILGDGNVWCKDGGYYYLRICGDSEKDRDYLLNYVKPLFEKLFKRKMRILRHKSYKEIFLAIGDKDVVYTLNYFGVPSGNKKINNVKIPDWIFESDEYIKSCIRGLIDTDGSVCPITGRNYPYIWFTSNIENLRNSFDKAMKKLNFKTSKWNISKNRGADIYIGNKADIKKYIEIISFKNKRHLDKLNKLKM